MLSSTGCGVWCRCTLTADVCIVAIAVIVRSADIVAASRADASVTNSVIIVDATDVVVLLLLRFVLLIVLMMLMSTTVMLLLLL